MFKNLLNRILPTPISAPAPPPVAVPDDIAAADAAIAGGNALEDAGQLASAEALYRVAVDKAPGHARAHLNLGIALAARDDTDGAAAAYEKVLAIDPAHPFGNYNYARLALVRGDYARAETLVAAAVRAKPDFAQALIVQSNVLDALGKKLPAVEAIEAALRLQPDHTEAWFNLAVLLQGLARPDDALQALARSMAEGVGEPDKLELRAKVLRDQGFAAQALASLRPVVEGNPAHLANRSFELALMNFVDGVSMDAQFRRHVEFGADLERAVPVRFECFAGLGDPPRRLRVGYIGADFHLHPVAFFVIPVLERHDRAQVEVFCYSYGSREDGVTEHMRRLSEHWCDAARMSDTQLADTIHADGIDVLVDLTGHAGQPRMGVFCQRPAPVQVSWVGYLNTTGLTRMDFRLCDERTDPAASSQPFHTERLKALPESQWCYRPMVDAATDPVSPLERNGFVTFGSFNAALKITSPMTRRWGAAMARLAGSRLLVGNVQSEHKRAAIRLDMASQGIAADRIDFLPRVGLDKYLALYDAVDVSLDTFPYGGGTTTFDSLWMGVPVVAAVGAAPVSRSAASILEALGLHDWIAPSVEGFVDVAVARASDTAGLAALRRALRPRLQASPLTDTARFVRNLETAYREMLATRSA
jgi:protein O-GlcNAc transferase